MGIVALTGEILPPAYAFQKITTGSTVRYRFDGTLPTCLMGFLFVNNKETGKIDVSKAIRAPQ